MTTKVKCPICQREIAAVSKGHYTPRGYSKITVLRLHNRAKGEQCPGSLRSPDHEPQPRTYNLGPDKLAKCGACDVREGELHDLYCDMERCPFCGGQLMSCGCANRHFYPTYDFRMDELFNLIVPYAGLPKEVYENGLSNDQLREWERILEAKGRVPFIRYPIICQKCGVLWPEFFRVSDAEWDHYIEPTMRRSVICEPCYDHIKTVIDAAEKARKG